MIDTKELRRLAQAATPHVGHACKYQDAHWLREGHVNFENADLFIASERPQEDAAFYAAANPAAITELLDRLEAAEKERDVLRDRLALESQENGALRDSVDRACEERDALRAKITEMERPEPVARMLDHQTIGGDAGWFLSWMQSGAGLCNRPRGEENEKKLDALPGAKGE